MFSSQNSIIKRSYVLGYFPLDWLKSLPKLCVCDIFGMTGFSCFFKSNFQDDLLLLLFTVSLDAQILLKEQLRKYDLKYKGFN